MITQTFLKRLFLFYKSGLFYEKPEPLFSKKLKKTVPLLILMDEEVSTIKDY